MHSITRENFQELLRAGRISRRLSRELRFVPESITGWTDRDFVAIGTRSGNEGVLLVADGDRMLVVPFQLATRIVDSRTGRTKPVICDICATWQPGGTAANISFTRERDGHTFTYLCCADLQCSLHVRGQTAAATRSRAQLHEDISTDGRIARIQRNLMSIIATLYS